MIAVIADDFTGAAEIGGIGLRHGLNVVIETEAVLYDDVDLLIVATDTRSLNPYEASIVISKITAQLMQMNPLYIYKKLDSVLRGNIFAELKAQMEVMDLRKTVVVAANPIFNRVIKKGEYLIDGVPLNHTHFSNDPEYPIRSSKIEDIIGKSDISLISGIGASDQLPNDGIIIGDVIDLKDLNDWCYQIDEETMPAGASGFFDSFLMNKLPSKSHRQIKQIPFGSNALFIFGSSYPKDIDFEKFLSDRGIYLSQMPEEMYFNRNYDQEVFDCWIDGVIEGVKKFNRVVVAVPFRASTEKGIGKRIINSLAILADKVIQSVELNELLIEGGSTTSKILNSLGIKKLFPVQEFETGIIRMKINEYPNLLLTTKPGSYEWPEAVWSKNNRIFEKTVKS